MSFCVCIAWWKNILGFSWKSYLSRPLPVSQCKAGERYTQTICISTKPANSVDSSLSTVYIKTFYITRQYLYTSGDVYHDLHDCIIDHQIQECITPQAHCSCTATGHHGSSFKHCLDSSVITEVQLLCRCIGEHTTVTCCSSNAATSSTAFQEAVIPRPDYFNPATILIKFNVRLHAIKITLLALYMPIYLSGYPTNITC